MSKQMQLTITVRPYYEKDIEGSYPKLASNLKRLDSSLVSRNPSLYELAGQLDQLLYRFDGTHLREVLLRHKDKLHNAYNSIQENIADWHLDKADKLLYTIEDIFDEIELELE